MPVSLDEIVLYTDVEIETHIRQLLRPGEFFTLGRDETWFVSEITLRGETSSLLWDHLGFDRRLLLLDAYGWLWARVQPASTSTIWVRQREITRDDVARRAASSTTPDPEDLDPEEVRSVYEGHHPHRKKV